MGLEICVVKNKQLTFLVIYVVSVYPIFSRFFHQPPVIGQALERLKGRTVAVKMTEIIIEENVACALVELPKGLVAGSCE